MENLVVIALAELVPQCYDTPRKQSVSISLKEGVLFWRYILSAWRQR
jgi:hypothetical protein